MQSEQDQVLSVPSTGGMQFLTATILPWRGMTIYQLRARIPAVGEVDLLEPPDLSRAESAAGGLLLPFANRLRGAATDKGAAIETEILGRRIRIPTNWGDPQRERLAIHGFILGRQFTNISRQASDGESSLRAELDAGGFDGHWLSRTHVTVTTVLQPRTFGLTVTATNAGGEPMPMGIGWHPDFRYPSGQRAQVRLALPSTGRALVHDYRDCFPTGEVVPLIGTDYDFSPSGGAPLGTLFLDDCFTGLLRDENGCATSTMTDPAARFRLLVKSLSKEISAIQVYAPPNRGFVAIEPQFNLADPFSPIWGKRGTGMVTLAPGQSVDYRVELELQEVNE